MNDPREHDDHEHASNGAPESAAESQSVPSSSDEASEPVESETETPEQTSAAHGEAEGEAESGKRLQTGRAAMASSGGAGTLLSGGVATSRAVVVPHKPKKGKAGEEDEAQEFDPATDLPMYREGMDWFVLRVASNKESSVRDTLLRKVQIEGMESLVGRIMVPTEKTTTLKGKKPKVTETKLYPGYVFVEMKLEPDGRIPQDVFFLIKETTGVGDFVGTAGRPTPMAMHEVEKMLFDSKRPDDAPTVRMDFAKGDSVTINEGPFQSFQGTVDEVLPEKGLVRVLVTIFGRQAPVELEYWQITRADD